MASKRISAVSSRLIVRSFHCSNYSQIPLPLLGVIPFLAKNLTLWNVYLTLNSYGWHRVYRMALRSSITLVAEPHDRKRLQESLKEAMRFPTRAMSILEESHVSQFLQGYVKQKGKNVPYGQDEKLLNAADTILQKVFPLYHKINTFRKNVKK
mmetsp:Transcript_10151/g.12317  ORF Transcript_10151/g.12317 Transcript_10151/m.12317 type:complete len:153 (-) Transcript_10151:275-733(-)